MKTNTLYKDILQVDKAVFKIKTLAKAQDLKLVTSQGSRICIAYNQVAMLFDVNKKSVEIAVLKVGEERSSETSSYDTMDDVARLIERVVNKENARIKKDVAECVALVKSQGIRYTVNSSIGIVMVLQYPDLVVAINHRDLNYTYHDPDDTGAYPEEPNNFKDYDWKSVPEMRRLTFSLV